MDQGRAYGEQIAWIVATGLGTGLLPIAPGTWATPLGLGLAWCLSLVTWPVSLAVLAAVFVIGIWASRRAAARLGREDPPEVVIDEVVGMAVGLWLVPITWWTLVAGFFLFRAVDIFKPWPINVLDQRLGGGLGIMVDDVAAGIVVNCVLQAAVLALT
jgi:phosphatidylglycerophosphatase A